MNWVHKLLEMMKAPNIPNHRPQIRLLERGDMSRQNHRPVQVFKKPTNVSFLDCKSTYVRTRRFVSSLVAMFVRTFRSRQRRSRKRRRRSCSNGETRWKWIMYRFVYTTWEKIHWFQGFWITTHAVVKQAESCRVGEFVKWIVSHFHRQALQADLQQSNVYNPFSAKSNKIIRDMGNIELFELCSGMFSLLESRNRLMHLRTSREKMNPADIFTDGDLMFSQSRTVTSKLLQPILRKRQIKKVFTEICDRFP